MMDTFEIPSFPPSNPYFILSRGPSADASYVQYERWISQAFQSALTSYWPIGTETCGKPVVEATPRGVSLNYESMERGKPYPVEVGGHWIIAVLHHGASQATLYRVPDDD